jgi:hypothetical protein
MASRRSIRTGRVCKRLGHDWPIEHLVCRRCHRDLPSIRRDDGAVWRRKLRKRGPWSWRLFYARMKPRLRVQPRMCHDCAFRPGSPERRDAYGTWETVLRGIAEHRPFYCHQEMACDARGHYVAPLDAHQRPIGHPLCAGWLTEHRHYHQPGHGLHHPSVIPSSVEVRG